MESAQSPEVSVIIPAHNAESFLGQCIESVLGQTLEDLELIIVNDGSTDDTFAIAEEYAAKDERVTAICQENQFAGVARNNGMARASGEYLYFLDADDFVDPSCLEFLVRAADSSGADVVVARSKSYDNASGKEVLLDYTIAGLPTRELLFSEQVAPTLFQSFVGWPWDKLFRRSFIQGAKLDFQELRSTNDAKFVYVAMAQARGLYCLDDYLVYHRINNKGSLEHTRERSWWCSFDAFDAIRGELVSRGLYEQYRASFVNWVVHHTRWNASTLEEPSLSAFLKRAESLVEKLPRDESFYYEPGYVAFLRSLGLSRAELIQSSTKIFDGYRSMELQNQQLQQRICDLERINADQLRSNNRLRERVSLLEMKNDALEQRVSDVFASASYKVGNVMIKPASMIKRAFHKEP